MADEISQLLIRIKRSLQGWPWNGTTFPILKAGKEYATAKQRLLKETLHDMLTRAMIE